MPQKSEPTYTVTLYMAGDIDTARAELRRECMNEGLCVTLTPTTFIYTSGAESGFAVGFVNYPQFPTTPEKLRDRAEKVLDRLMNACCQRSGLLVTPDKTTWLTREVIA